MTRTRRRPLTGHRAVDKSCRNGTCPACRLAREAKVQRQMAVTCDYMRSEEYGALLDEILEEEK